MAWEALFAVFNDLMMQDANLFTHVTHAQNSALAFQGGPTDSDSKSALDVGSFFKPWRPCAFCNWTVHCT